MSDRGMKKWAPYASLIEQKDYLNKMKRERSKVSKPKLSPEQAEEINDLLLHHEGDILDFSYYQAGYIETVSQTIRTIDLAAHIIRGSELDIPLKDLVGLVRHHSQ